MPWIYGVEISNIDNNSDSSKRVAPLNPMAFGKLFSDIPMSEDVVIVDVDGGSCTGGPRSSMPSCVNLQQRPR